MWKALGEGPIIIRTGVSGPARRMFEGLTSVTNGDYPLGLNRIGANNSSLNSPHPRKGCCPFAHIVPS